MKEKNMENHEPSAVLNPIFGPTVGRILEDYLGVPVFFLNLHPRDWTLQYYAGSATAIPGDPKLIARIADSSPSSERTFRQIDELVRRLAADPGELAGLQERDLFDAATTFLLSHVISLGWRTRGAEVSASPKHLKPGRYWELERSEAAPLRWFQTSLDVAFQGLLGSKKDRKLQTVNGKQCLVHENLIEAERYLQTDHLVDTGSFQVYLAEFLYSQRGKIPQGPDGVQREKLPSELNHFFLPLNGLGQWRAAACWLMTKSEWDDLGQKIVPGFHESIQLLFSQILIDAFGASLDQALIRRLELGENQREQLRQTFAALWWSQEVAFFRGEQCVARKVRGSQSGTLEPTEPLSGLRCPRSEEEFLTFCSSEDRSTVQLALHRLPGVERATLQEFFGYDRVLFSVPLMDDRKGQLVESLYAERISERLATALRLHRLQQSAIRVHNVEAFGHHLKGTVKLTGWSHALQRLQGVFDPGSSKLTSDTDRLIKEVQEGIRALSFFVMVEGSGGLLRLVSLCSQGNFSKIEKWTSPGALVHWERADSEVFARYVFFIERFIAVVCQGMDWRCGFQLRASPPDAEPWERRVSTHSAPLGSVKNWIVNPGPLAPFSASEVDSHIALLTALIEPVSNAITHLVELRDFYSREGQLYVEIAPDFPKGILVSIGNDTREVPDKMPPGLELTAKLFQQTHLATLSELRGKAAGQYWIQVNLHPIQLVNKIAQSYQQEILNEPEESLRTPHR